MKWINYEEWEYLKNWYKEMGGKSIEEYMHNNKGLLDQIQNSNSGQYYTSLTLDILDNFINELTMSKRKYKGPKRPSKELIESVFELFKPNKVQLFFMSALGVANQDFLIGGWLTGNKKRVRTLEDILKLSPGEIYELELKLYLKHV